MDEIRKKRVIHKNSYGILLYSGEKQDRKYLLIQNRDTEAFIYFFLAWNMEKWMDHYFIKVIRGFSRDELNRLLYYSFDAVYRDLYVNHAEGTYQKQYDRAQRNYDYFHSRKDWVKMCHNVGTTEIKWGFSKGRIEPGEDIVECALRELEEETGIDSTDIKIRDDLPQVRYVNEKPLFKTFVNVALFPARCDEPIPLKYSIFKNTIRCVSISDEILHAKWVSIEDAVFYLPSSLYRLLYEFHIASSPSL